MSAPTAITSNNLRRLTALDAEMYRELRLDGLQRHPDAFGSSWEDEAVEQVDQFAERLQRTVVVGAFSSNYDALYGAAGLHIPQALKMRHKGVVWGMYVRPQARGSGIGASLLGRLIDLAVLQVEALTLTVGAANTAAIALYNRAGFEPYGLEKRALKIGGEYYDEILMGLALRRSA